MPLTRIRTVRDILWSSFCFIVQVLTFRLSLVLADEDFYRCVIEPVEPPTRTKCDLSAYSSSRNDYPEEYDSVSEGEDSYDSDAHRRASLSRSPGCYRSRGG